MLHKSPTGTIVAEDAVSPVMMMKQASHGITFDNKGSSLDKHQPCLQTYHPLYQLLLMNFCRNLKLKIGAKV
jgi:hypothetical protein